jgi:hypothetical protein
MRCNDATARPCRDRIPKLTVVIENPAGWLSHAPCFIERRVSAAVTVVNVTR